MSGFDLPPIIGFEPGTKQRLPGQSPVQGPEGAAPGLGGIDGFQGPTIPEGGGAIGNGKSFSGVFADSLEHVRGLQTDVRDKVRGMVMGEDVELHDVMIASSKSEVAFNLLLEVRNKMVDAWEKLSRSSG